MKFGARECPVTKDLSSAIQTPFYNDLTENDQAQVVGLIKDFFDVRD